MATDAGVVAVGSNDFMVTATIDVPDRTSGRRLGDVGAAYDPASRRGWTLGALDASPCGNYPNGRELCFTLDAGTSRSWEDLGEPSPATIMRFEIGSLAADDAGRRRGPAG